MSLYRRWKKRRYCDGCLQTSQLRHLDIVSHLRRLEVVVAIATLWAIVSQLRRLPPNVTIATLCLSVGIATLFYKRRYSDGFMRDGKNLGKFPTFGQKCQNQVSEFPPNVVVTSTSSTSERGTKFRRDPPQNRKRDNDEQIRPPFQDNYVDEEERETEESEENHVFN